MDSFASHYLATAMAVLSRLDAPAIDRLAETLATVRDDGGRLFIVGLGGSAATASHAVNDFRKLCHFEAYCPTDNSAELTARANDDRFSRVLRFWLRGSRITAKDAAVFLSVSGQSPALVLAADYATSEHAVTIAVLGRQGSTLAQSVGTALVIPCPDETKRTAQSEGAMSVVLHCLVSHPALQKERPAWEARQ